MDTIIGQNDMRLCCALSTQGTTILRVETADETIVLPDMVFDQPVIAVGERAFAVGSYPMQGKIVQVVCKKDGEGGDNSHITSVTLPDTVQSIGAYAFFNCEKLRTFSLCSNTARFGACALMNCKSLSVIKLRLIDENSRLLKYFVGELPHELDVSLTYPNGEQARLLFPEYYEYIDENVPARIFDYHIMGAGYPYRYCFKDAALDLRSYDELWTRYLSMDYDVLCANKLAFYRLRYPHALSDRAHADYFSYVQSHLPDIFLWLLDTRDMRAVDFLLRATQPDAKVLSVCMEQARQSGCAEALAMLLEAQHRRAPVGIGKRFDL
ncbi:MAG: leucine-rich repeat domain-containing protein [Clostridia bacterium]|nr:leucine-rich repeat domain-containing protein [Clostridia bacterium]